ncbi:hypothetical protein BGAL_0158g00200 [Botrytis galanthina]|uniref:FAD dependent oxidoreductase domain-containing protein n=1 Tax=Botrytis galanthina TaxID=278940 RepID=A0A4S8R047_9HELO|nr:hypothetical protein BGAL_0158g00200 [Botrytis galanthina]
MKTVSETLNDLSISVAPSKSNSTASKCLPVSNPGECFWQYEKHRLHDHRSTEDLPTHSDVVIVGAGYAGVSTAYHLVKEGGDSVKSITIIEALGACSGATGRNGGHLRPDLYGHIPTYVERGGPRAGAEIAEFEIAHVKEIKKLIEKEKIDCDFSLCRTVDVWCNEEMAKKAKAVYDQMVKNDFEYMDDVIFHTGKEVEGICGVKGAKACASYTAGSMWPYKFILGLLEIILPTGKVNLQTNTPVTSVTSVPSGGFTIGTNRGNTHASKIIYANNAYISALLPEYDQNIVPCKGICCRITVPEGKTAPLLNNTYINRTEDNTLSYLIPRADGSIIVGGAGSKFRPHKDQWYNNVDDSVLIESAKDYYENYMQETYNGWEDSGAKVDNIWTGVMGYSYDSNPHVGEVPGKPNQFVIAGFNGHGMPVIWLSGKAVAKMISEDVPFEKTGVPRLFKTTQERIDRAKNGSEEQGDILGTGNQKATKQ